MPPDLATWPLTVRSSPPFHGLLGLAARRRLLRAVDRRRQPFVETVAAAIGAPSAAGWTIVSRRWTDTGVLVVRIRRPGAPLLVAKLATEAEAAAALDRQAERLQSLATRLRDADLRELVPAPLGLTTAEGVRLSVESAVPGASAVALVRQPAERVRFVAAAFEAIGRLHAVTSRTVVVGDRDLERWVEPHVDAVERIVRRRGDDAADRIATRLLRDRLQAELHGRRLAVGWIHGDYWPGNILVADGATSDGPARVSGIVDWDLAADHEPAVQDLWHLLIFTRCLAERRELGRVTADLLMAGPGTAESRRLDAAGLAWPARGDDAPTAILLAWLRHVGAFADGRQGHSPVWVGRNVRPVLAWVRRAWA